MIDYRLGLVMTVASLAVAQDDLKKIVVLALNCLLLLRRPRDLWLLAKTLAFPTLFFGLIVLLASGWREALVAAWWFVFFASLPSLFFVMIGESGFLDCLRWLRLPPTAVLVCTAAWQFLPTLRQLVQEVREAQIVRGLPLDRPWQVFVRFPALFIPILIGCLRLADSLAATLVTRGAAQMRRQPPRTPWSGRKWIALGGVVLAATAIALPPI